MPAVMYHFVGCDENLKGISLEGFRAQLDYLERTHPRDEIIATFDHGTIDHIEKVAPELERRGIQGIFFLLTMVPEERRVHAIDKQRYLEASLRFELARMLCDEIRIDYRPDDARDYLGHFDFYSPEERYLRFLRDTRIPADAYNALIGKHFEKVFGPEEAFAAKHYLSWGHITHLRSRGHVIGSHSHYHHGDRDDYTRSVRLIEDRTKEKVRFVSYPNGVKRISDADLERLGVEKAFISSEHGNGRFTAGRIDCNQLQTT